MKKYTHSLKISLLILICFFSLLPDNKSQKAFSVASQSNQKLQDNIDDFEGIQVTSISPSTARIEGRQKIVVEGKNFTKDLVIVVGDKVVGDFKLVDSNKLSFFLPRQNAPGQRTLSLISGEEIIQKQINILPKPVEEIKENEITTLVGGVPYLGDGEIAKNGQLLSPSGMALDSKGRIYIADTFNHRIRRFDLKTGIIITVAGSGTCGFNGDGNIALAASLAFPTDIAFDSQDNMYILDSKNYRVRKVDVQTNTITTVIGNGIAGFSGDGDLATKASLNFDNFAFYTSGLGSLAVDSKGNLFVGDYANKRVRKVEQSTGIITTIAGGAGTGVPPSRGLPALKASFFTIEDLAIDSQDNLYIADRGEGGVYKVNEQGLIEVVAGNGLSSVCNRDCDDECANCVPENVLATKSPVLPRAINFDSSGNLYIFDINGRVRKVDAVSRLIVTIAGNGRYSFSGDGDLATNASFGIDFETVPSVLPIFNEDILITDTANNRLRVVSQETKLISTLIGKSLDVQLKDGMSIQEIRPEFFFPTLDNYGFLDSLFLALATNSDGELFFSDPVHHQIWQVDSKTQKLKLIAGTGKAGFGGDGDFALNATLNGPRDLSFDKEGNLYIADTNNNRVRCINAKTNLITTVAGNGKGFEDFEFYFDDEFLEVEDDGEDALDAVIPGPVRVVVDAKKNLFTLQESFSLVRKVDSKTNIIGTAVGCCLSRPNSIPIDISIDTRDELRITTFPTGTFFVFENEFYTFNYFEDFTFDTSGIAYLANANERIVVKSTKQERNDIYLGISLIGNNKIGYGKDATDISKAQFVRPARLALVGDKILYIFDPYATAIRVIKLP